MLKPRNLLATLAVVGIASIGLAAPASADPIAVYGGKVKLHKSADVSRILVQCENGERHYAKRGGGLACNDTAKYYVPKGCTSNYRMRSDRWVRTYNLINYTVGIYC